ncbi:MAG: PKD domain-containing protein, partial [Planctomycetota bacterium]
MKKLLLLSLITIIIAGCAPALIGSAVTELSKEANSNSNNKKNNNPPAENLPPVSDFAILQDNNESAMTFRFTDESTGNITSWYWDFNSDGVVDSTEQNPTYSYTEGGTYTVTLIVTGEDGVSTRTIDNTVFPLPPEPADVIADFGARPISGTAPLTVQFFDQSTGPIGEWLWDFNSDGIIDSTEQNPVFTYYEPGSFSVTLTVISYDVWIC